MFRANRYFAALVVLLALCLPARAFWVDGTCSATRTTSTSIVPNAPTGTVNPGDLVIITLANATTNADITISGGTGAAWTVQPITGDDGANHNVVWNGTTGRGIVITHVWAAGNTYPTVTLAAGNTGYVTCAYYGVDTANPFDATPVFSAATTGNPITYPSLTPAHANSELLQIGFWLGTASGTITAPTNGTTCSQGTVSRSISTRTNNSPDSALYEANQGSCAPAATTAATSTVNTGATLGFSVLLKSAAFASKLKQPLTGVPYRDSLGIYQLLTRPDQITTWDITAASNAGTGMALNAAGGWVELEPTCTSPASYMWDLMDNMIINARIAGLHFGMASAAGSENICGAAGGISCSSANWDPWTNSTPDWLGTAAGNSCDGGTPVPRISSYWMAKNKNPPRTNKSYLYDIGNANFLTAIGALISAEGTRYAAIPNVTEVAVFGMNDSGDEVGYTAGGDGSTVECAGGSASTIAADCNAISGDADWQSAHAYSVNNLILPTVSSNNTCGSSADEPCVFKVTSCSGTCTSAGSEPTFAATCPHSGNTCTDNAGANQVVWTNQGPYTVSITNSAQWALLGYTVNTRTCADADGTYCGDMFHGLKTIEADLHTAFPSAELDIRSYSAAIMNGSDYGSGHTVSPCNTLSDWAGTHTYAPGSSIYPLASNGNQNWFYTAAGGVSAAGGSELNWNTSCGTKGNTCPADGTITDWVNEGGQYQGQNLELDPLANALQRWHYATYKGIWREMNNAEGMTGTSATINRSKNLPYCEQPFIQIGFQPTGSQHGSCGGYCQTPPNYSISANNGVMPSIYDLMQALQFPYLQAYTGDLDDPASVPWFTLFDQYAHRQSR